MSTGCCSGNSEQGGIGCRGYLHTQILNYSPSSICFSYDERLDPVFLRPGHMDMHIHMSYCTPSGFKILAANYLNINSHPLYTKIEKLMIEVGVTQQRLQKSSRNARKSMLLLKELSNSWKGRRCSQMRSIFSLTSMLSAPTVLSTYTTFAASAMLVQTMLSEIQTAITQIIPLKPGENLVQDWKPSCEIFLHTKIPPSVQKLKVKWEMVYTKKQSNEARDYESRSIELSFPKKNMKKILSSYLPFVVDRSEAFIEENKSSPVSVATQEFRRLLVSIRNQSILVIEDIDCSSELQGQQAEGHNLNDSQLMLSELLNSIDGLWSSCGDKQIIVLNNYHKERLDPGLLRPGCLDMHIHMS
ncbi:AAA-ATPase [Vitis vinifera]|uniref:AAA-ATPase n=1 Tax=Vitis vinifera TaxID=29760 RepID=A0A438DIS6_VITVI|nr:AAA-ATPase [Vitis vinifera]